MIEFKCPHCEHTIKAQLAAAGIRSKCPRCKANITVPMPESSEPVYEEEFVIEGPKRSSLETWHKVLIGIGLVLFILIAPRLVYKSSGDIKEWEESQKETERVNKIVSQSRDDAAIARANKLLDNIKKEDAEKDSMQIQQMGRPFTVDGFRYTVHSAGYLSDIGTEIFRFKPSKKQNYLIVDVSVENVGKSGNHVTPPKLKDENQYEYDMDSESLMLKNFFDVGSLNPGLSKRGLLAFSVPVGKDYRIVLSGHISLNTETREVPLQLP